VDAPTDAIVDAETGCLLRLISYAGDTLVIWSELDDISTEPADPDEFRVHVPPARVGDTTAAGRIRADSVPTGRRGGGSCAACRTSSSGSRFHRRA
jgi:hypothetical protein